MPPKRQVRIMPFVVHHRACGLIGGMYAYSLRKQWHPFLVTTGTLQGRYNKLIGKLVSFKHWIRLTHFRRRWQIMKRFRSPDDPADAGLTHSASVHALRNEDRDRPAEWTVGSQFIGRTERMAQLNFNWPVATNKLSESLGRTMNLDWVRACCCCWKRVPIRFVCPARRSIGNDCQLKASAVGDQGLNGGWINRTRIRQSPDPADETGHSRI